MGLRKQYIHAFVLDTSRYQEGPVRGPSEIHGNVFRSFAVLAT